MVKKVISNLIILVLFLWELLFFLGLFLSPTKFSLKSFILAIIPLVIVYLLLRNDKVNFHKKTIWFTFVAIVLMNIGINVYYGGRCKYTQERWRIYPQYKAWMIPDMEKKIDLKQMTKDEIIKLFGKSYLNPMEYEIYWDNYLDANNEIIMYSYIYDTFLFPGKQFIVFEIKDGKVVNYCTPFQDC